MNKRVVKFGGSNLRTKEDIRKLITVVRNYDEPLVIVVSAWYGLTDRLQAAIHNAANNRRVIDELTNYLTTLKKDIIDHYIDAPAERARVIEQISERLTTLAKYLKGVHYLGEAPDFTNDLVMSFGERLSALLLEAIFNFVGIPCEKVKPEEMGLITDGTFRNARINFTATEPLVRKRLNNKLTNIVPGFYGVSPDKRVTLLGRGGTDYTAAAIARCIEAPSLDLWKDVAGFMSADPRLVERPKHISALSFDEAAELSYFGAKIIHPMTVEPLSELNIPVRVFSINDISCERYKPSIIGGNGKNSGVKSVTYTRDVALLNVRGPGIGINPGVVHHITSAFDAQGLNIKSIFTSQTSINFLMAKAELQKAHSIVTNLSLPSIREQNDLQNVSLVAIVGDDICEHPETTNQALLALIRNAIHLRLVSLGASSVASYFIVDEEFTEKAVQVIHEELF